MRKRSKPSTSCNDVRSMPRPIVINTDPSRGDPPGADLVIGNLARL